MPIRPSFSVFGEYVLENVLDVAESESESELELLEYTSTSTWKLLESDSSADLCRAVRVMKRLCKC